MKKNHRFRGFTMFVFNFSVVSLEQSVKLGRLVISISLVIPFSKHLFFQTNNQKAVLFSVFIVRDVFQLLHCCCSGKRKPLKMLANVSLANFQDIQIQFELWTLTRESVPCILWTEEIDRYAKNNGVWGHSRLLRFLPEWSDQQIQDCQVGNNKHNQPDLFQIE